MKPYIPPYSIPYPEPTQEQFESALSNLFRSFDPKVNEWIANAQPGWDQFLAKLIDGKN